jgi:hypothetical protein
MLVTGNRLSSGKILSNISFFDLAENEHKTINVSIRKDLSEKKILGKVDLEKIYSSTGLENLIQSCTKYNGLVIVWFDPEKEPSKHIFNDLQHVKSELDSWGGKLLFFQQSDKFIPESYHGLPANTSFGIDRQMNLLKNSVKFNVPTEINLPVAVVTDKNGNILYVSSGYRIGIGEQILKYLH